MLRVILLLKMKSFKAELEYPANFLASVVSVSLNGLLRIPWLLIMIGAFGTIGGWDFWMLAFMGALIQMGHGLHHGLFFSFFDHLDLVRTGAFDRLLVRPIHPILQIMASSLNLSSVGEFVPGLLLLLISAPHVQVAWNLSNVLYLVVVVLSGAVIEWAVYLFFATFDFWFGKVGMMWIPTAFLNNISFPIHIYGPALSFVLTFVFPYAFIAYYPTLHFFQLPAPAGFPGAFAILTPLVAAVAVLVAVGFWSFGLRHYQSTGT